MLAFHGVNADASMYLDPNRAHALGHQGAHVCIQGTFEDRWPLRQDLRRDALVVERFGYLQADVPTPDHHGVPHPGDDQATHCQRRCLTKA